MPKRKHNTVSKRLARVERELKQDKPEVKVLDILLNPLGTGVQLITRAGIYNGVTGVNYDLTRGFIQGLLNTGGNIDGNYCKLTSMDMRIYLNNNQGGTASALPTSQVRLMIVRLPAAEVLTPSDVQNQVLEYGVPATYGQLCYVSPLKRNSTINSGYDVMYDRVHTLSDSSVNPTKSTKYIHFRKKWKNGLTLRFSGSAGALVLEQNRILLFAMDVNNAGPPQFGTGVDISFINRIRYSDE